MNKKIKLLINFLKESNLKSYADRVEGLIKIAADLSLNQKTYNIVYSVIKKNSEEYEFLEEEEKLEFFSGENKSKLDLVIEKIYSIMFSNISEEEKYFPVFSNQRGVQIACLNWCTIQAIEDFNLEPSDEDLVNLVSTFATITTNKGKMYYHAESDQLKVVADSVERSAKEIAKDLKREGYKPLMSSPEFNDKGIYYRGMSSYNKLFRLNGLQDYKEERKEKVENIKIFKDGTDTVYKDEDFIVTFLKTHEACRIGYFESTSWCITMDTDAYWNQYSTADNLHFYVIEKHSEKDKKEPMRKIAVPFSFEELYEEELRDKNDKAIKLKDIKKYLGDKFDIIFGALKSHRKSIPVITDELAELLGVPNDAFRGISSSDFKKHIDKIYQDILTGNEKSYRKQEFLFNYIKKNYKEFSDEDFAKYVSLVMRDGFFEHNEYEKIQQIVEDDGSNLNRLIKAQNRAIDSFGRSKTNYDIMIIISDLLSRHVRDDNEDVFKEVFEDKGNISFVKNTLLEVAREVSKSESMFYKTNSLLQEKLVSPIFFLKMTKYLSDTTFLKDIFSILSSEMEEEKVFDFFDDLKEVVRSLESYEKIDNAEENIEYFISFMKGD